MNKLLLLVCLSVSLIAVDAEPRFDLRLHEDPLIELCESVAKQLKLHVIADDSAVTRMEFKLSLRVNDVPLDKINALLLEKYDLLLQVDGAYLRVQTQESSRETMKGVVKSYSIDLINFVSDMFPGPWYNDPERLDGFSTCMPLVIASEKIIDTDDVIELIEDAIEPDQVKMFAHDGYLVVLAQEKVHQKIDRIISVLEDTNVAQIPILIYELEQMPEQGASVIAVSAMEHLNKRLVGNIPISNGQRNHFSIGQHQAFLSEVDLVGSGYDPVVSMATDALVIDIEPQLTHAGVLMTVKAYDHHLKEMKDIPFKTDKGLELTKQAQPQWDLAHSDGSRLVPYGSAVLVNLNEKWYAIVCDVTKPETPGIIEE